MTGLTRDTVIGRRVTSLHPGIDQEDFDWIDTYGRVAGTGETVRFSQYFTPTGRWYDFTAFSDEVNHFAVVFRD